MRSIHYLLAVAVISAGTCAWANDKSGTSNPPQQKQSSNHNMNASGQNQVSQNSANLPQGIEYKDLHEESDIRSSLAGLTNVALQRNDFTSFTNYFVDADRNRFSQQKSDQAHVDKSSDDALNGQIAQFRQAWKNKYGSDFDASDSAKDVFSDQFVKIHQGEISDSNLLAQHWPVAASSDLTGNMRNTNLKNSDARDNESDRFMGGQKNLDKGRNVAVVILPASHGLPQITLSMIHELPDSWVLDIPDNIQRADLQRNLSSQLTQIMSMQNQWPADQAEAKRLILHRIAMAAYGVQGSGNSQMAND